MTLAAAGAVAGVVFAGIAGEGSERIETQVAALLLRDAKVEAVSVADDDLLALALRRPRARAVVRGLDIAGIVAGRLRPAAGGGEGFELRLLLYDAEGRVRHVFDATLAAARLDADARASIRAELVPRIAEIAGEAAAAGAGEAGDQGGEPGGAEGGGKADRRPKRKHAAGDEGDEGVAAEGERAAAEWRAPEVRLGVGLGVMSRIFAPPAGTFTGWQSHPLAAMALRAEVRPLPFVGLRFIADRSLGVTTAMNQETAPTRLARWEAAASLVGRLGDASLGGAVGYGERAFTIASVEPDRSPDTGYKYLVMAVDALYDVSDEIRADASLAFDPVVAGRQPVLVLGEAERLGFEVSGGIDARPTPRLLLRAAIGYQRFGWTWSGAQGRSGFAAADGYFTATFTAGFLLSAGSG